MAGTSPPPRPKAAFDPERLLTVLDRHEVAYMVIGGIAGIAYGSPTLTADLDICYQRTRPNMAALANALRELGAELKGAEPGLPFQLDARTLELGDRFTFETDAGGFDCLGTPDGTTGYDDLIRDAVVLEVFGHKVQFASLDDLIRMKRAAGRSKDLIELEVLGALREEIDEREQRNTRRDPPAP
jgi:hypothetical protein